MAQAGAGGSLAGAGEEEGDIYQVVLMQRLCKCAPWARRSRRGPARCLLTQLIALLNLSVDFHLLYDKAKRTQQGNLLLLTNRTEGEISGAENAGRIGLNP